MHPFTFLSRRLSKAVRNYDVVIQELPAVEVAREKWQHWLEGANHLFIVWADHKNFEYIQKARLNSCQARWPLFFNWFSFSLSYRLESRNGMSKPDALSQLFDHESVAKEPETILPLTCVVGAVTWQIEKEVKQANSRVPPLSGCPENWLFVPTMLLPAWASCSRFPSPPDRGPTSP